jgi:nucleoside-diphosphate-sugar epimerase
MTKESVNTPMAIPPGLLAATGRVLVLGGGYSGLHFGRTLAQLGCPVSLTWREVPPAAGDTPAGLRWIRFDPANGILPSPEELAGTTHVLVTIPPDRTGQDPVLNHLAGILKDLPLAWVGYLSTPGVYGARGGGWVDETTPGAPGLERSRARLRSETAWRQQGLPLQVFRLPAIYGPGRTPFRDLLQGKARLIHKPGQVFCRIHVDDLVGTLLHCIALAAERRPDTLIVADTEPCPSSETLGYAAHLLGSKLPDVQSWQSIEASMSPMARSFWSENRRVNSRVLREELGYHLLCPSYREGYQRCFL